MYAFTHYHEHQGRDSVTPLHVPKCRLAVITGPVWHGGGSTGGNLATHVPTNLLRMNRSLLCLRYREFSFFSSITSMMATSPWKMNPLSILSGGFTLDIQKRLILYSRVCQARDLPSVRSASPENVLLSGIFARAPTFKQCSFPEAQMLIVHSARLVLAPGAVTPGSSTQFTQFT